MATHNGEKYIKEQLDSILSQLSCEDELIISDDGSTDNTINIIEQYNDQRITVIRFHQPYKYIDSFATHRYATKNFENALSKAKGEYIFLCDQDDVWMPNKVSTCIDALKHNVLIKHNGNMINEIGESLNMESSKIPISKQLIFNIINLKIPGSHIAFRRELLNIALPFPKHLISHDGWLGCLASYIGDCISLNTPLILYRIHSNNVSVQKKNSIPIKILYRIGLLFQIIRRILKSGKQINKSLIGL